MLGTCPAYLPAAFAICTTRRCPSWRVASSRGQLQGCVREATVAVSPGQCLLVRRPRVRSQVEPEAPHRLHCPRGSGRSYELPGLGKGRDPIGSQGIATGCMSSPRPKLCETMMIPATKSRSHRNISTETESILMGSFHAGRRNCSTICRPKAHSR